MWRTRRSASAVLNLRQAGDRNAPSVLNAVYYFRNFWDGRASDTFTGATPFGLSDTRAAHPFSAGGSLKAEPLRLDKSSLASQSVGPVLNLAEMSYDSRSWPRVGKKMLALRPLANQRIATDDSVLGRFANSRAAGISTRHHLSRSGEICVSAGLLGFGATCRRIGKRAELRDSSCTESESVHAGGVQLLVVLRLAIQAYESTLVSDDCADGPLRRRSDHRFEQLRVVGHAIVHRTHGMHCLSCRRRVQSRYAQRRQRQRSA